jgi:membrane protein implicated in regulation of membrane protease activity
MSWMWWVGAALLFGVIELLSLSLVLLMFAGGALAGALAAGLGANSAVQTVVAALVSVALLVALRPWLLRHLRKRGPLEETNVSAQVGRIAIVVAEVSDHGGRVKLVGEVWSARSAEEGVVHPVGSEVRVLRIEGATAVVEVVSTRIH